MDDGALGTDRSLRAEPRDESLHADIGIAEAIVRELRRNPLVPETVKAEVRHGLVALHGEVEWLFQREEAERALRDVDGIVGVSNMIVLTSRSTPTGPARARRHG